ncbi:OmpA family protein [Campylobacter hominis]|uniref:Putative chemotaxis protein MotB n=1 Tax=Campylobacter hominis (strain ATCC BAA-381 / DSM 21671 / CCUG 45161 / LMG 19568 / NCTC 13146 / CH001A) TaxID=360107 RepID=A7I2N1_CAMHC|nr:OmpA family protein [Campylobacter hominis]ABS51509.1 putative chemotaxis protein MotB [Campylobacter hominis ATCC BAA-381]UAK85981.1 OmpA family protein [Campylobacter hominis]SUW85291.1 putative chemotaxis protein MotB [Campylobacter hominis]
MKNNNEEKSTFWIAYADLMAGLLFVFVLLVGGIIVKYFLTQTDLQKTQQNFANVLSSLQDSKKKSAELEALNKIFADKLDKLNVENEGLRKQNSIYFIQIEDLEEMAKKLKDENFDLNKTINKNVEIISENDTKIAFLLDKLTQKESDFNKILHDLNVTKNRIRNLTGMKVKVITDIREKLGNSVKIDNNGALTLSSSVLFDKGSWAIKDDIKNELKRSLQGYFNALLNNDEIRQNLDQIIIEGHTDSDGDYIYNLALSQNRAFAVMDFINSWNKDDRLKKYIIASGKSFMSPVLRDGVEDKDASRRIEIKFTLSNKEAINEIQKFLEYDTNATKSE